MRRRHVLVAVIPVAIAAILGIRALRSEKPSAEEQVKALFVAAALAAEERRTGDVLEPISERFRGGDGLDRQGLKRYVLGMVLRGEWVAVQVAGIAVVVDAHGDLARAKVDIVTARSGKGRAVSDLLPHEAAAHRITCLLEREPGGWKVVAAEWAPITLGEALAGPPAP